MAPFGLCVHASAPGADVRDLPVDLVRGWTLRHSVVVLRGFEKLDADAMVAYARTWGELLDWNFGVVLDLRVHETPQNYLFTPGNVPFHWDGAFARAVPSFQFFQCIRPPGPGAGGETLFSDTRRALRLATPEQRRAWRDVEISYSTEKLAHYGGQIRAKLVATHPHTGDTTIRFAEALNDESVKLNPLFVDVAGMSPGEQEALFARLRALLYDPRACYAHAWKEGDVVFADNHALLHGRRPFRTGAPRHLRRIHIL
jgi:alpha-ketoglutarate-dependent taurine dioxygenase